MPGCPDRAWVPEGRGLRPRPSGAFPLPAFAATSLQLVAFDIFIPASNQTTSRATALPLAGRLAVAVALSGSGTSVS